MKIAQIYRKRIFPYSDYTPCLVKANISVPFFINIFFSVLAFFPLFIY